MKPYYADELVTLYLGDSEDVISDMLSEFSAPDLGQIVVTSPPYNQGLVPGGNGKGMYRPGGNNKGGKFRDGYENYDDAMPQDEYDGWQRRMLDLMWSIIPNDGAIFYNHKQRVEHGKVRMPLGMDFGIPLRQIITWDRGTGIGVNLRHYASVSEFIFLFAKPQFVLRDHSASGSGDVWRLGMSRDEYGHPATFPLSLPAKVIQTTGARSVLDPFAGTGTTLRAASDVGIRSFGIEKSERYCEIAAKRLQQQAFDFSEFAGIH